jgi:hypothetical protein
MELQASMISRLVGALTGALLSTSLNAGLIPEAQGRLDLTNTNDAYHITHSYGGSIAEFIEHFTTLRDAGAKVVLDDFCISACTLTLALLPSEQLCAKRGVLFGFHSAWQGSPDTFAKEATRLIWNLYPEMVRVKLRELGWDGDGAQPHPELIYVRASEFVRTCGDAE